MKKICFIVVLLTTACGGNLSDEQRKKFKEGMEQQKIVRVTESEIMEGSLRRGHEVVRLLEGKPFSNSLVDSVEKAKLVKISWTVPGAANALAIEQELIDAYIEGMATGTAQENIQKIYSSAQKTDYDTLLYTKPAITRLPDGSDRLDGIWNIYIPRKQVILEISKNK